MGIYRMKGYQGTPAVGSGFQPTQHHMCREGGTYTLTISGSASIGFNFISPFPNGVTKLALFNHTFGVSVYATAITLSGFTLNWTVGASYSTSLIVHWEAEGW